jgi:hypothetical protein
MLSPMSLAWHAYDTPLAIIQQEGVAEMDRQFVSPYQVGKIEFNTLTRMYMSACVSQTARTLKGRFFFVDI